MGATNVRPLHSDLHYNRSWASLSCVAATLHLSLFTAAAAEATWNTATRPLERWHRWLAQAEMNHDRCRNTSVRNNNNNNSASVSWCSTWHSVAWSVRGPRQSRWQTERHWFSGRPDSVEVVVQRSKSSPSTTMLSIGRPSFSRQVWRITKTFRSTNYQFEPFWNPVDSGQPASSWWRPGD